MKSVFGILIISLVISLFPTAIFAFDEVSLASSATPSPTPEPEPALSQVINKQIDDLRQNLKVLGEVREAARTPENIKNEIALRQSALFKIIDISLNENIQTLKVINQIKDLNEAVLAELKRVIEADNSWYQKFILKVNLAVNLDQLKIMANEIKNHRQEVRGLTIRRLVGLILILQELKAISIAQGRAGKIKADLDNINSSVRPILGASLEKAVSEIDTAYQLARSSQLRLEKMTSFEDFEYARDWLERANEGLKNAYQIFGEIAEKAK